MSTHRASRWRRSAAVAVVLLSTYATAACGLPGWATGSSGTRGAPTATAPTPTRVPQLPDPPGAEVSSANAFVRLWTAAYNEALTSGDLDPLRDLASRTCESCQAVIDPVGAVYDAGGHITTDGWEIRKLRVLPTGGPKGSRAVYVRFLQNRQTVVSEAEAEPEVVKEKRFAYTFHVRSNDGAWLLTRLSKAS